MDRITTFPANFFENLFHPLKRRVEEFMLPLLQPEFDEVQPRVALDRPIQIMGFCFAALSITILKIQNLNHIPTTFHFACLALTLSFVALSLSVSICGNYEALCTWLENLGIFFATTTFFLAMSVFSPLPFQLAYWILYALLLLGSSSPMAGFWFNVSLYNLLLDPDHPEASSVHVYICVCCSCAVKNGEFDEQNPMIYLMMTGKEIAEVDAG